MSEMMIFIHYRLNNPSLSTVIYVNNLCPQVGDWGRGDEGTGRLIYSSRQICQDIVKRDPRLLQEVGDLICIHFPLKPKA